VQAERIRRNKPWERSTGPKSATGKARSKMNAFKHGEYMSEGQILRDALKLNQVFVERALLYEKARLRLGDLMVEYLDRQERLKRQEWQEQQERTHRKDNEINKGPPPPCENGGTK